MNRKSKNVLCCCACGDPNTDPTRFIEHFEHILSKISKEKKQIFILGDFNFDLLKYHSDSETQDFLHSFMSNGLLPTIHQPTRVTTRTGTIIDNIYTTSIEHELIGGNILINITDHMSQFLILNKLQLDYKSCSYYEHDYSEFNETKLTGLSLRHKTQMQM